MNDISQQPNTSANTQESSHDYVEESCKFGCCTFVQGWYKIVATQKNIAPEGADTTNFVAEICPKCHGIFTSNTSLLPWIQVNNKDKMGQNIQRVYPSGEDFTIYRTDQGVIVNFADCRERERDQRAKFIKIAEDLCNLRFLSCQMAPWRFWRRACDQGGGFYDHEIAQAIYLALQGDANEAGNILRDGLKMADDRLTNENRIRYLLACLLTAVLFSAPFWLAYWLEGPTDRIWTPYLLAGAAGGIGAAFSIATRVQSLHLKPCFHSVMNYVTGGLRVLTGFEASIVLLLIINSTFLAGIAKALPMGQGHSPSDVYRTNVLLLGFLAGFAERLVPSVLQVLQSRAGLGSASTEPVA
jgi:hypothetical protein